MTTPADTTTDAPVENPAADLAPDPAPPRRSLFASPPCYAALLPNSRFFTRIVPITEEAAVVEQVDLALETLSPFPLTQLYHGHFWQAGAPYALVFAAYRKRFLGEETQLWPADEIVMPAFAIALAVPAAAGTTRVSLATDSIAVLHWADDTGVPTQAVIEPLDPALPEGDRTAAREQLLRNLGLGTSVEDWSQAELLSMSDSGDLTFNVSGQEIKIRAELAAALDVRDKFELAERSRLHRRDIWLWRTVQAAAALLVLCVVGAVMLQLSQTKYAQLQAQYKKNDKPVQEAKENESTVNEIEQRTTHRYTPLEMLSLVTKTRPDNTVFTQTNFLPINGAGASVLQATFRTISVSETETLKNALKALPEVADVTEPKLPQQQGATPDGVPLWTDTLNITFQPDAVKPETIIPDPPATTGK